jgi:hypothetical protein
VTATPYEPRDLDRTGPGGTHAEDDLSIVPGLGPVPEEAPAGEARTSQAQAGGAQAGEAPISARPISAVPISGAPASEVPASEVPAPRVEPPTQAPTHYDRAFDPDRYDPSRETAPVGRLDPASDPDRFDPVKQVPPGQGQTLPDLLGEGAYEEKRDGYEWAIGLLGVLAFLALVSWSFGSYATP